MPPSFKLSKCFRNANRLVKGCLLPGVQVFPSVCRLIPVGQAQLEALGAGARRQRWLQPPLFTEHGLRTTDGDTQTNWAHPPSFFLCHVRGREWKSKKLGQTQQKHATCRYRQWKPFRKHRRAPHVSEISEVSVWYEPLRLSALSACDLGSVYL